MNDLTELQQLHAASSLILQYLGEHGDMADLAPIGHAGIDRALRSHDVRGLRTAYRDSVEMARAMSAEHFAELRARCLAKLGIDIAIISSADKADLQTILSRGAIMSEIEYELVRSVRESIEVAQSEAADVAMLDRLLEAFERR
jgi:hypothetical protein